MLTCADKTIASVTALLVAVAVSMHQAEQALHDIHLMEDSKLDKEASIATTIESAKSFAEMRRIAADEARMLDGTGSPR